MFKSKQRNTKWCECTYQQKENRIQVTDTE